MEQEEKNSINNKYNVYLPVANYYVDLNWTGGFEQWKLVRFETPMDGNCLFHSITNSFYKTYRTEPKNSRLNIIKSLRKELANKLKDNISDNSKLTHYDVLNNGNTKEFSKNVPEFKLEYMMSQLDSNKPIGYGYLEFIGNVLNKDIYILDANTQDIYITDELPLTIKGNRNSIVIYYSDTNKHYELVGIMNGNSYDTYFSPNHSLIRFLYQKVCDKIQRFE